MLSRTISFVKRHPIFIPIMIVSVVGYWVAPLLTINPFLLAGICAAGSMLLFSVINYCFMKRSPTPQIQVQEHKREPGGEEKKEESELSQEKAWIIHKIRQAQLTRELKETLENEINAKNNHDELDQWIRNHLVRGHDIVQTSILIAIRNDWIFKLDSKAFNFFKKCLLKEEKKPTPKPEEKLAEQKSACLKLLKSDFKHILPLVERFAVPFDETSFRALQRAAGESTITNSFVILLAREGRLRYLEYVFINKAEFKEFKPDKEFLFNAIKLAADNDYLPVVKFLIKKVKEMNEKEDEILPAIFTIALTNGYLGMFRWLLLNYDDSQLSTLTIGIQIQIRASRATIIGNVPSPDDPFITAYSKIRRIREEKVVAQPLLRP